MFDSVINTLMNTHLPVKTFKQNSNDQPWITDDFRRLIGLRQFHFHAGHTQAYNYFRNITNRKRKQLQKSFFTRKLDGLKSGDAKKWWNDINSIIGKQNGKDSLQGMANTLCDGDMQCLADKINTAFASVCLDIEAITPDDDFTIGPDSLVADKYIISVSQVEKNLSKINTRKAIGPDGIPNWVLCDMATNLAPPICAIWNSSFRDAYIPTIWKSGNVAPIPKINPPMRVDKDLRPISLTPVLSKGIEWFARDWVMEIIDDLLDPQQYGSRKGCSTLLALAEWTHKWIIAVENPGILVRILLLDFRKAFDRVDHGILLQKLANSGIPNFLLKWIAAFLCERQQRIKTGQVTSQWATMNAGVPQGTLLGPVCFLLHINDLQTEVESVKYVDDTTVWEACNSSGQNSKIQLAADQAVQWSTRNNMILNTDKTKEMLVNFGRKTPSFPPIQVDGQNIESVRSFKLLGVIFNNKLTWTDHVESICSKAARRIYFLCLLKRAGLPPSDIVAVYCSVIRSVLEYACEIWHPGLTQEHTKTIEHIQKRALDITFPCTPYSEALTISGLESLEKRRESQCKKFFTDLSKPEHKLHHLLPELKPDRNLRHTRKFNTPKIRTNRMKHSPIFYGLYNFQD